MNQVEVKNFDTWLLFEGLPEGSGRSEKEWLRSPDGQETGLFKYPKITTDGGTTTEFVSEHLAYRIGEILGVPTARIDIGQRNGRIGCMSYLLIDPNNECLIEGVQFILMRHPKFDVDHLVDTETGKRYCIDHVFEFGEYTFRAYWIQMMLFDFVIGNSDRHQSNWGYLLSYDKGSASPEEPIGITACPLYDNGSSLCASVSDRQLANCFSKDSGPFNALVDSQSKSMIRIDGNGNKPRHTEVVRYLLRTYRETEQIADRFLSGLTDERIEELLDQYPEDILCAKRNQLIRNYLHKKRAILAELVVDGDD